MVDAQFERAVFVATLGYWVDYQEAHVPVLNHVAERVAHVREEALPLV